MDRGIIEGGAHLVELVLYVGELARVVGVAEEAVTVTYGCGCSPNYVIRGKNSLAKTVV